MGNKHSFIETEKITKLLIKFSLPAMVGMFVNALYNIVDRIYIGNIKDIGHLGITGVGISFPIIILIFSFALLIGIGGAASMSLKLGEKDREEAEKILGVIFFFSFSASILLMTLINIYMDKIIMLIGGSEQTFPYAKTYLWYLNWGAPGVIVGMSLNAAIRADGSPKMAMTTLLLGAITNIILDPIFIFYFGLGIKGAAIATIISQYLSTIWTIYYFKSDLSKLKIHKKYIRYDIKKIKKICALGSSAFAIQIGFSLVTYFLNKVLKKYGGDISIGAMAIIQSIISFMVMPIFGINQGIQPILGYNYGARKYARVRETMFKAMALATTICIFSFLISQFFASYLIRIFTSNKELEKLTAYGLRIYTLVFPIIGFQIISSIYFQAIGKPKMSFLISSSRQILFMIPSLFILAKLFGIRGVWYATPVADSLSTFITFFLIKHELKHLKELENLEYSHISKLN